MSPKVTFLAKALLTVALLFLVFRRLDWPALLQVLISVRWLYLVPCFLILWGSQLLCVFRWQAILKGFQVSLRYLHLARLYFIGMFFSLLFPTTVGGDAVKVYLLGKEEESDYSQALVSVFMERNVGLFALIAIGTAFALARPVEVAGIPLALLSVGILAAYLLVNLVLYWFPHAVRNMAGSFPLLSRLSELIRTGFQYLMSHPTILAQTLAISFLHQFFMILISWLVARSLGSEVAFVYFLMFIPLITLVTMVPLTMSGVGLREAAFYTLFTPIGLSAERAVLIGTVSFAVVLGASLPGGLLYLTQSVGVGMEAKKAVYHAAKQLPS
ncbi:MAG: flippase-like domain-containing protein [Acidobacteria bacterium]|nr:flippase-like domain-containing protein [Acidobacteriota bacterium]